MGWLYENYSSFSDKKLMKLLFRQLAVVGYVKLCHILM